MRYYDPLLAIIQENVSEASKEHFNLKNNVAFTIHRESDFKTKFLEQLGLIGETKDKLSYKFNAVNKKAPYEISHHNTNHA